MWQIRKPSRLGGVEDEEQRQRALDEHRLVTVGDAGAFAKRDEHTELKVELHQRLIELINLQALEKMSRQQIEAEVGDIVAEELAKQNQALNQVERKQLLGDVLDELLGLGPLEPLLKDPTITDILVNGHDRVFVERSGDGMEHLYSTQIVSSTPWSDTATVLAGISTAAHEYFHTWNVKRIRPRALGPFDYSTEQWQPSLWVAEGWTQYYGQIGLLRAGVVDKAAYYRTLGRVIQVNSEQPGRKYVSARMSSFLAPLWDGAPPPMDADRGGSFISYYTKGDALALLLDLEIRSRSGNTRSLDDALRSLKKRTWDAPSDSYYLQGRGYTEKDIEEVVSEAAGTNMHDWFERYVNGVEELPFARTLALAGVAVSARGTGDDREYVVEELPNATAEQLRVRVGWLNGTTSSEGR